MLLQSQLTSRRHTISKIGRASLALAIFSILLVAGSEDLVAQTNAESGKGREVLYVVDSDMGIAGSHPRVLVLDPATKKTLKIFETGSHPDIAVSPDGRRLYLAYDYSEREGVEKGKLEVIDTVTGVVLKSLDASNRWQTIGPAYDSGMAISPNGRWLFVYKYAGEPDGSVAYATAIFDTVAEKFLPDLISLPNCGVPIMIPFSNNNGISVTCQNTMDIRAIRLNNGGVPETRLPVGIPIPQPMRTGVIGTTLVSDDGRATVVMANGRFSNLNLKSGNNRGKTGEISFSPPLTPAGWRPPVSGAQNVRSLGMRFIATRPVQEFGGKVFVTLSRSDRIGNAGDAIAVLDTTTLQQIALFETPSYLFWNAVLGGGGQRLYLLSSEPDPKGPQTSGVIHVLNPADGSEVDKIVGIGRTPTILISSNLP